MKQKGTSTDPYKNTNAIEIFCDMDGVLTDLIYALQELGFNLEELTENKTWIKVKECGIRFWSEMKWTDDGQHLWNYLLKFEPTILSALAWRDIPNLKNECREGKALWIQSELSYHSKYILCDRHEKQNYAHSKAILIDDTPQNILEWQQTGGIGILHLSAEKTINEIGRILENEENI